MDFDKFQERVTRLSDSVAKVKEGDAGAMKEFARGLKEALVDFLKHRREAIHPGRIARDAAAKNIIPGDVAPRLDALLVRWGGNVTPAEAGDDAGKMAACAEKVLPVLRAYTPVKGD